MNERDFFWQLGYTATPRAKRADMIQTTKSNEELSRDTRRVWSKKDFSMCQKWLNNNNNNNNNGDVEFYCRLLKLTLLQDKTKTDETNASHQEIWFS